MIQRNHKIRLEDIETEAINEMLMSLEEPFKGAEIGEWINSGGQAAVHHLNTKTSSEKYVIKVLTNKKGYEKAVRFNEDFVDICEQRQKNDDEDISKSILKVERSFITNTDDDILYCMIEKYHFCLKEYDGPESNKTKDDIEIATRIGADLLPVLSAIEGKSFHRDIKPGNIFFKQRTLSDGFCLGDFGIVTNVNTKGTPTTKNIRGTHETASPDIVLRKDYPQFRNSNKGDMYSLAVTMYYYLNSREYPFIDVYDDDDELDYDIWEEIRKKGCEPPKHGSQKLKEIVCKAVEFYPDDRFASCAEMLEELKKTEEYRYFISEPIGKDKTIDFDEKFDEVESEEEIKSASDSQADEAPVNELRLEEYESDEVSIRLSKVQIPSGVTDYRGEMFDGRYRILEAIGLGDMHVVYRAYDTETKNIVAAKILRNEIFRYDTIIEKYQKKIKQAYQKSYMASRHENIAQILGYGTNDSESYVIMEYVDGITLRESIENYQKVNALYTCGISLQILRALHHIHSNEYFHGNICPENIMLCSNGNVMLIGFDSVYGSDSDYRSSTQKYGAEADVDSDIYALGVVMYEMLTECRPFDSENPLAASLVQGLHAEIKHPMEINSEVPKELDKIIMKALKINQVDGYRSAAEMIMELDEFYQSRNKPSKSEPTKPPVEKNTPVDDPVSPILGNVPVGIGSFLGESEDEKSEIKPFETDIPSSKYNGEIYFSNRRPTNRAFTVSVAEKKPPVKSAHPSGGRFKNPRERALSLSLGVLIFALVGAAVIYGISFFLSEKISEGSIGDNAEYVLYGDGKMVISGTGELGTVSDSLSDFLKSYINQIEISEGITSIGECAFSDIKNLRSVSLSDTVTDIGSDAFVSFTAYKVNFLKVIESSFLGCDSFERFSVDYYNPYFTTDSNGVLYSKDGTRLVCYPKGKKEKSFSIPEGVMVIDDSAFIGCENLESISIPHSVIEIDSDAFNQCINLSEITLSDNVMHIGSDAFYNTEYYNNSENWENGALYVSNHLVAADSEKIGQSYSVKYGTVTIADEVFCDMGNLAEIEIPDSVKNIGMDSFYGTGCYKNPNNCDENGVLYIGNFLVDADSEIVSGEYTVREGTKAICDGAFAWCSNLTSVSLPDSLTYVGEDAFSYCTYLKEITWSNRIKYIGEKAFYGCSKLSSVNIPSNTVYIGEEAFDCCYSITSITVDENNSCYSSDEYGVLFNKDKSRLIQFPAGSNLTSYDIPEGVTHIEKAAFGGQAGEFGVEYGLNNYIYFFMMEYGFSNYQAIEKAVSIGGNSLAEITLPDSVTYIGDEAFSGCGWISTIEIPASVKNIGENVFSGCIKLERITVDENNFCYSSDEYGMLFNKYQSRLIYFPRSSKETTYNIPDNVSKISSGAFYSCILLEKVVIPGSVTDIEDGAFDYAGLKAVSVDENNRNYASDEFGVLYNKDYTELLYYPCESEEKSYEISDRVTKISSISECEKLTDIYYAGTQERWEEIASESYFGGNTTIHYNS